MTMFGESQKLYLATHYNDILWMVLMGAIAITIIMIFSLVIVRLDEEEQRELFYEYDDEDASGSMFSSSLFKAGAIITAISVACGCAAAYYMSLTGGFVKSWEDGRRMRSVTLNNGIRCLLIENPDADPQFALGVAVGVGSLGDTKAKAGDGTAAADTIKGLAELAANFVLGESRAVDMNDISRDINVSEDMSTVTLIGDKMNWAVFEPALEKLASRMAITEEELVKEKDRISRLIKNISLQKNSLDTAPYRRAGSVVKTLFDKNQNSAFMQEFDSKSMEKALNDETLFGKLAEFIKTNYVSSQITITVESIEDLDVIQPIIQGAFDKVPQGPRTDVKAQAPTISSKFSNVLKIFDDENSPRIMLLYTVKREFLPFLPFVESLLSRNDRLQRLLRKEAAKTVRSAEVHHFNENRNYAYLVIEVTLRNKTSDIDADLNKVLGILESAFSKLQNGVDEAIYEKFIEDQRKVFHSSKNSVQPSLGELAGLCLLLDDPELPRVFIDNVVPSKYWTTKDLQTGVTEILDIKKATVALLANFSESMVLWVKTDDGKITFTTQKAKPIESTAVIDLNFDDKVKKNDDREIAVKANDAAENTSYGNVAVVEHFVKYAADKSAIVEAEFFPENHSIDCGLRRIVNDVLYEISKNYLLSETSIAFDSTKNSIRFIFEDRPDVIIANSERLNTMINSLESVEGLDDLLLESLADAKRASRKGYSLGQRAIIWKDMIFENCPEPDLDKVNLGDAKKFLKGLKTSHLRMFVLGNTTPADVKDIITNLTKGLTMIPATAKPAEQPIVQPLSTHTHKGPSSVYLAIPFPKYATGKDSTQWIADRMIIGYLRSCFVKKMYSELDMSEVEVEKLRRNGAELLQVTATSYTADVSTLASALKANLKACLKEPINFPSETVSELAEKLAEDFTDVRNEYANLLNEFRSRHNDYKWYRVDKKAGEGIDLSEMTAALIKSVDSNPVEYYATAFQMY